MREPWQAYVAAAGLTVCAGVVLWAAIQFRRGALRQVAAWYWDPTYPWHMRNIGLAYLPGAMAIALLAAGSWLAPTALETRSPLLVFLGIGLGGAAFLMIIATLLVWRRPPEFLKPDWLRAEEARRGPPPAGSGWIRWFDRVVTASVLIPVAFVVVGTIAIVIVQILSGTAD